MWHQYRVDLYPHVPGLLSGILDEFGHEQEFPSAFRKTRVPISPRASSELFAKSSGWKPKVFREEEL